MVNRNERYWKNKEERAAAAKNIWLMFQRNIKKRSENRWQILSCTMPV